MWELKFVIKTEVHWGNGSVCKFIIRTLGKMSQSVNLL